MGGRIMDLLSTDLRSAPISAGRFHLEGAWPEAGGGYRRLRSNCEEAIGSYRRPRKAQKFNSAAPSLTDTARQGVAGWLWGLVQVSAGFCGLGRVAGRGGRAIEGWGEGR